MYTTPEVEAVLLPVVLEQAALVEAVQVLGRVNNQLQEELILVVVEVVRELTSLKIKHFATVVLVSASFVWKQLVSHQT